jgi:hypothetical protein
MCTHSPRQAILLSVSDSAQHFTAVTHINQVKYTHSNTYFPAYQNILEFYGKDNLFVVFWEAHVPCSNFLFQKFYVAILSTSRQTPGRSSIRSGPLFPRSFPNDHSSTTLPSALGYYSDILSSSCKTFQKVNKYMLWSIFIFYLRD